MMMAKQLKYDADSCPIESVAFDIRSWKELSDRQIPPDNRYHPPHRAILPLHKININQCKCKCVKAGMVCLFSFVLLFKHLLRMLDSQIHMFHYIQPYCVIHTNEICLLFVIHHILEIQRTSRLVPSQVPQPTPRDFLKSGPVQLEHSQAPQLP